MMRILRSLWLVVAHDLSEYRYMDDVSRNLLFCFCSTGARFWKCLRLFRIKESEKFEKSSTGAIYKKEKYRNGAKKALDYFRMPKLQEIFTTAAIVFHRYERLAVLQMFSPSFCFEQEKTLKKFSKKLYAIKIKKKRSGVLSNCLTKNS